MTSWPDHGVPDYATSLLQLRKKALRSWNDGQNPILVHCSAGVGRTGTFIAIDMAIEQANKEGLIDIPGIVNRLRQQRMKMVQTEVYICNIIKAHMHTQPSMIIALPGKTERYLYCIFAIQDCWI